MSKPIIGMMTIGDPREHEWNHFFLKLATEGHAKAKEILKRLPVEVVALEEMPRSIEDIKKQAEELKAKGAECFVLHIACWTWPNMATIAVQSMGLPTILFANRNPGTHSTVGLLGAGGALNQIGYKHIRFQANYDDADIDEKLKKNVLPMIQAAHAVKALQGSTFCLFGGRSLGIDTGTYDPMQWKSMFGIDCEHVDQLEIIRRTEIIDADRVAKMKAWLTGNSKEVRYGEKFTDNKFDLQIRCYLATKDILAEKNADFAAIKCMPDLTNNYTPQCLSAAFIPTPFDGEGKKEPLAFACEADADAALTMHMMKLVTGGMATMFADVSHLEPDDGIMYLPNCGAYSAWFAKRSDDPEENMSAIRLVEANRPAGGAITLFVTAPGPVTLARLTRTAGKYKMYIIKGEMITPEPERHEIFSKSRGKHQLPMSYIKTSMDFASFVKDFDSNHIAGVGTDCVDELANVCNMLDIPVTVVG